MVVETDVQRCGCLSDIDKVVPGTLCGVYDVALVARSSSNFICVSLFCVADETSCMHVLLDAASGCGVMYFCSYVR